MDVGVGKLTWTMILFCMVAAVIEEICVGNLWQVPGSA